MTDKYKVAAELMKENPGMKSYEAIEKAKEVIEDGARGSNKAARKLKRTL